MLTRLFVETVETALSNLQIGKQKVKWKLTWIFTGKALEVDKEMEEEEMERKENEEEEVEDKHEKEKEEEEERIKGEWRKSWRTAEVRRRKR